MKDPSIKIEKLSKEALIALCRSAEKMSELLKAHGISEDEIIAEFDAMRKQARRDATK
ncbi:MAG: hypothetical protein ACK6CP_19960 [Pseudanabaena sp.]|jgi:hypothetical protein|nr:hypothetical protein [Pseudanabaena sp. M090S1SP2A07QC]MCA6517398.1 hypothetical protein [Pseudanabaena sp. M110S1SP2A07QC]MCA6530640.1 hypothetical protein [Pseudanabaena sp. M125S2SP2A07QC]MCA6533565.1 hypothetical protein [Pseudanabaena sp. M176S2SP2A07QC]MCA6539815.1 hypothetical protein [Pseudanabaena sp. M037S2SP2A07QC]MCA6542737.1 hypothetical protein [Pseudanabaena sp. M074S1SP2A07QC]MCA6550310.1 hypothetical protein [Pseudanabaena sp. M152S2SP2A07QC]MCA6553115.1 hypothetical prot